MTPNLHLYQHDMVRFMLTHPHCALLVDMGLGKTLVTLTVFNMLHWTGKATKALVIAPKKVAESTWSGECEKWDNLHRFKVAVAVGDLKTRTDAMESDADIIVTGRDNVIWLKEWLVKKRKRLDSMFDMVILDELTSFKSHDSKRFKALKNDIQTVKYVYGLTGTPAPNGYQDLWAQMYLIDGGKSLGRTITEFRQNYCTTYHLPNQTFNLYKVLPSAREKITRKIADDVIRLSAKDYLQLPALNLVEYKVKLGPDARKTYERLKRDMLLDLPEGEVTADNAASLAGKMLQVCNGAVYVDGKKYAYIGDEKLDALEEIIEQAKSPVLVFYQFQHDVSRIMERLKDCNVRKYETAQDLKDWNDGKIDVLLAHPASCAYGLNMQEGGHIAVWFGTGYNLELYQQAVARLHRQGQMYPVYIYHLICEGTIDETAYRLLQEKGSTQDNLFKLLKEIKGNV